MSAAVQEIVAITACVVAAGFVAWRAWRAIQGRLRGCGSGGCGTCPSSAQKPVLPEAKTLLSIEAGIDSPNGRG